MVVNGLCVKNGRESRIKARDYNVNDNEQVEEEGKEDCEMWKRAGVGQAGEERRGDGNDERMYERMARKSGASLVWQRQLAADSATCGKSFEAVRTERLRNSSDSEERCIPRAAGTGNAITKIRRAVPTACAPVHSVRLPLRSSTSRFLLPNTVGERVPGRVPGGRAGEREVAKEANSRDDIISRVHSVGRCGQPL